MVAVCGQLFIILLALTCVSEGHNPDSKRTRINYNNILYFNNSIFRNSIFRKKSFIVISLILIYINISTDILLI